MTKSVFTLLIVAVMAASLVAGIVPFCSAQAGTQVSGIIGQDTTWAKGTMYLTGNVLVNNGVTLTIEAGTAVNLNSWYIMVNGTLKVKGEDLNRVTLSSGKVIFTNSSTAYDEQAGSGSVIDEAFINSTNLEVSGSPKISNSRIEYSHTEISNGSPVISNNKYYASGIRISDGSPIIFGNDLPGGRTVGSGVQYFNLIIVDGGAPIISNNYIHNGESGIEIRQGNPYIYGNNITGCTTGILANAGLIERNYVASIIKAGNATFRNNTMGIEVIGNSSPTLSYNDISYHYLYGSADVDASNNWWGTTNTTEIDQKIWDYNDDFNLGKVNYTPFLTEPNLQALPDPNAPIPTHIASQTPTLTPTPIQSLNPSQTVTPTFTPSPSTSPEAKTMSSLPTELTIVIIAVVVVAVAIVSFLLGKRVGHRNVSSL